MINSVSHQINIILICFFAGIISGFIYFIFKKIKEKYQKKFIFIIFDIIFALFCGVLLIFLINKYYFGQFYLLFILAFLFGIFCTKKLFYNALDFIAKKLYTLVIRLKGKLSCKKKTQNNSPNSSSL